MEKLDVAKILAGSYNGHHANCARRSADAKEGLPEYACQVVQLRSHIDLAEKASELNVKALGGLSSDKRQELLGQVMPFVSAQDIPSSWAVALLGRCVAEMTFTTSDSITELFEAVAPGHENSKSPPRCFL